MRKKKMLKFKAVEEAKFILRGVGKSKTVSTSNTRNKTEMIKK
jgi:hypothetical protein